MQHIASMKHPLDQQRKAIKTTKHITWLFSFLNALNAVIFLQILPGPSLGPT